MESFNNILVAQDLDNISLSNSNKPYKILIIDEDDSSVQFIQKALKESSYLDVSIVITKDLEEALTLTNENFFLILLSQKFLNDRMSIPICILKGFPYVSLIILAMASGNQKAIESLEMSNYNYITEHEINPKLLDKTIRFMLERYKTIKELKTANSSLIVSKAKLKKANDLATFIGQVNQKIAHIKNSESLFSNACLMALEFGKFKIAWIGLLDNENYQVNLIEQRGIPSDDLIPLKLLNLKTHSPQEYVMRTGNHFVCNDIENDKELTGWKQLAKKLGIQSCIILPIKKFDNIVCTFNLYAIERNYFEKEEIALLVEITRDISFAVETFEKEYQRIQAKLSLENSESRLKEAQKIAHIGNWDLNLETGITSWSEEACKIYGLPINERYRQTFHSWFSFVYPEDKEFVLAKIHEAQTNLEATSFLHRILRRDSTIRHVHSFSAFEFDIDGKPVRIFGVVHDITDMKIIEEQREFDKHNLHSLINNTNDLLWSIDINMNLITCNRAFQEAVRYMSGNEIKQGESILKSGFTKEQLDRYDNYYRRAFKGETFTEIEHNEIPLPFWSEISFYPIRDKFKIVGTACYAHNITKQKLVEIERATIMTDLVQRNKDLQEFAAMVSHNLRAPLANIIGLSHTLKDDDLTSEQQSTFINGIFISSNKLDEVVREMNDILKPKGSMSKTSLKSLVINPLI